MIKLIRYLKRIIYSNKKFKKKSDFNEIICHLEKINISIWK